jgi:hemoglobin/transferrin/lactoferrin receptor protein
MGKIFDSQPGSLLVPNPQLRPEYAYNAELNLNKVLYGILKLDVTGYYTWLDKAMVRRPTTFNGQTELLYSGELSQLFSIQNAAFAEVKGIQAGFELALSRQLLLSSNYNWQKGVEELDDKSSSPSRHAAPAFGASKLRLHGKKGTLELSAQYSAAMPFEKMPQEEIAKPALYATDAQGKPYSPSWMIINLAARIPITSNIQINAGVENLLDLQYRGYSSGIVNPGRNFQVSVKGTF